MFEEQLVSDNSTLKTAVAISATGNHARAWMIPVADKTMSNHEFMDAMRLRCAVPLSVCQSTCACGKSLSPDNTSDLHLLKCPAGSGYTAVHRHSEVVAAARKHIQRACLTATVEPTLYEYEDAAMKRPDFTVFFTADDAVAYDVTVVFPDEPGSSSTLGVSASDKHQKHTYAVEHAGHKFSALAMETFGHMDSAVDRFVTDVAAHVPSWEEASLD